MGAEVKIETLFDVRGKSVLVTGGSAGIGAMIARAYVENGARVYISSRKANTCQALVSELSQFGFCKALPADLSTLTGADDLKSQFISCEQSLDILVNNAGATWGQSIEEYSEEGWDKVFNLNIKSVFFLTTSLLPQLRAAVTEDRYAKVINIASVNGLQPPQMETYAYSASKAGCIMLTRHLAKRLAAERILVNAIAPGPFSTKMMAATLSERGELIRSTNPLGRVGEAEDIAGVALFLASRASDYTTGAVIPCDGGSAEL